MRGYFEQQEKPTLLEVLLDELKSDPKRWRFWLRKLDLSEQGISPAKLKSLVNKALPNWCLWERLAVRDYFSDAAELFEEIWEGLDTLTLESQWQLTCYVWERLNAVLLHIDDSIKVAKNVSISWRS